MMGAAIGKKAGALAGATWGLGRRNRWAAAGTLVTVGAVLAGTVAASASGPPPPSRTAAQLLAQLRQAKPTGPMTAVVQETANLGFPALPDIPGMSANSAFSASSLIAGTHTFDLWYGGPRQVRIAMPVKFGETDLRVSGNQVWLWQSQSQTATRIVTPAGPAPAVPHPGSGTPRSKGGAGPLAGLTPAAAAQRILALVGPTTIVTAGPTTSIAGHDAYQLLIEPRSGQSLIGQILIAFDARTMLPLRVQVTPRGSASIAFEVTYTSLTYGAPAASNFTFTPPPGAKVKTIKLADPASQALAGGSAASVICTVVLPDGLPIRQRARQLPPGTPMPAMPVRPAPGASMPPGPGTLPPGTVRIIKEGASGGVCGAWVGYSPAGINQLAPGALPPLTPAQLSQIRAGKLPPALAKLIKLRGKMIARFQAGTAGVLPPGSAGQFWAAPPAVPGPQVLGKGWLTVVALPAGAAPSGLLPALPPLPGALPGGLTGIAGQLGTLASTMLKSATPVSGAWGKGKLLRTTLLTVLITSKGQVLAGAVTPDVLYADVSLVK